MPIQPRLSLQSPAWKWPVPSHHIWTDFLSCFFLSSLLLWCVFCSPSLSSGSSSRSHLMCQMEARVFFLLSIPRSILNHWFNPRSTVHKHRACGCLGSFARLKCHPPCGGIAQQTPPPNIMEGLNAYQQPCQRAGNKPRAFLLSSP